MEKHPNLKNKFQLLYLFKLNPKINNNVDLGNLLGKTKQSISRWCTGTPTSRGNCIPSSDVERIAEVFQIEHEWLSLPFAQFEERVRALVEERKNPRAQTAPDISIAAMPITGIDLVGRDDELNFLDSCWLTPTVNVLEVIAFGGTGKSSLINKWLSEFSQCLYRDAEKIYAWSFYWQGQSSENNSSGDYFIEHALAWFGDESPSTGTPWSKAARLANLIRKSKTLLILDGLEPLQYPPGKKHGQIENPAVSFLIRELASSNPGLMLITTRSFVADVKAFTDGRVATLHLSNLAEKEGIELLRKSGVTGSRKQFQSVVRSYSGHPLSLSLIAGYLATVHRGELDKLTVDHSVLDDTHQESHVSRIMSEYMEWLEGRPGLQILRLVSLIDRNISLHDLKHVANINSVVGVTDQLVGLDSSDWGYSIKELVSANLLLSNSTSYYETMECHPLIKDFILCKLKADLAMHRDGNKLLLEYFKEKNIEEKDGIVDLDFLYRAVFHAIQAGMVVEGFRIHHQDIKKGYIMTQGSHSIDQKCISSFFKKSLNDPIDGILGEQKYFLLASAATNMMSLGYLQESINLTIECMEYYKQNDKWADVALAAGPLISMLIVAGDLEKAIAIQDSLAVRIEELGNPVISAMANNFRAYTYHLNGKEEEARKYFMLGEEVLNTYQPVSDLGFPTVSAYYCKFLLDNDEVKEALERSLKTFAWRNSRSWQVEFDTVSTLASDLLFLGLIFLKLGDKTNAKIQLDKQVELFRSADEWLYLPTGLNSRAKLHLALRDLESATRDLQESLKISEQTGAKFGEWEACLDLAQLHIYKDDYSTAATYLFRARSLPEMNNYRFRDREIEELQSKLEFN